MSVHFGNVTAFDDEVAYGEVCGTDPATEGRRYFFHCTQIADGTRTIDVGAAVAFSLVAGRMGRWEAVDVRRVPPSTPTPPVDSRQATEHSESDPTFPCPVCGTMVAGIAGDYEICPTCNWEDDPVQHDDPSYAGGANAMSLHDARNTWQVNHNRPRKNW